MIRVLITDDNAVIRQGLASLLEASGDVRVVGQATNGKEAIALAASLRPDVVLLDARMPITDGPTAAATISQHAKVLMLTYADDEATVTRAIRSGASGYLVHGRFTPDELRQAVLDVAGGRSVLSPAVAAVVFDALRGSGAEAAAPPVELTAREVELMGLLVKGSTNQQMAQTLFLSEKTVKNHLNRMYAKLGVNRRSEAVAVWLGISPREGPGRDDPGRADSGAGPRAVSGT